MAHYYDRQGKSLPGLKDWAKKVEDPDYKNVAQTTVDGVDVSTVWLGLNHNYGKGKPLIFETMIFGDSDMAGYCFRYSTEEEAEEGHAKICVALSEGRTFEYVHELDDIHVDFSDTEPPESDIIEI